MHSLERREYRLAVGWLKPSTACFLCLVPQSANLIHPA